MDLLCVFRIGGNVQNNISLSHLLLVFPRGPILIVPFSLVYPLGYLLTWIQVWKN
jgi:hypothetical protein